MRVALDVTYGLDPQPSGVARYSNELARKLACASALDLTLCARWPRFLHMARQFSGIPHRACWLHEPLNLLLRSRTDIFHGLNQRLPEYRFRRQVVTVHDVFALSSDTYSTEAFRKRFAPLLHDAVSRADRIICVSTYTRLQLCRYARVPEERCTVVHHGVEQNPPTSSDESRWRVRQWVGNGPFVLCVGAIQTRKNTLAAVRAIGQMPSCSLVLAGSLGHGGQEVIDFIRRNHLDSRVHVIGYVDESTLNALYVEAVALLFPSLEEGFGFPLLEAMVRGLPVIAARTSSIPEIAGDAAILVDVNDVDAMVREVQRLIEDESWRAHWIAHGRERVKAFTWDRTAAETLTVYRSLL